MPLDLVNEEEETPPQPDMNSAQSGPWGFWGRRGQRSLTAFLKRPSARAQLWSESGARRGLRLPRAELKATAHCPLQSARGSVGVRGLDTGGRPPVAHRTLRGGAALLSSEPRHRQTPVTLATGCRLRRVGPSGAPWGLWPLTALNTDRGRFGEGLRERT